MRFLMIGECMAELAPAAHAGEFTLGFAGDTFNTAWYLAHLVPDSTVSYFTAAGDDAISAQMREMFTDSGIDDSHVVTIPERSVGLYMISLDNGERSFSYWRGQSAARLLARDAGKLAAALEASDLIYFSGITLAILEDDTRQTFLDALRDARAKGKTIAFDPNLRPRLWADTDTMLDVIMQGAAVSDIALPSYEDEATWFNDASPSATADRYINAGAKTVVVKNGPEPVCYRHINTQGTVDVPPLAEIVDTTAAGDSFNAEILAGVMDDTPLPDRIKAACALAGQVVRGKGALVSINLTHIAD